MKEYLVALENFHGPLRLLVVLMEKGELHVVELSLQELLGQHDKMSSSHADISVDDEMRSLYYLSHLSYLKARMLLPQPLETKEEEGEAPLVQFLQVVQQVGEYTRFQKISLQMASLQAEMQQRFCRGSIEVIKPPLKQLHFHLETLVHCFQELDKKYSARGALCFSTIDSYTVENQIPSVLALLSEATSFKSFCSFFKTKEELIVSFLALLELIKSARVTLNGSQFSLTQAS